MKANVLLRLGLTGSVLAALCCFTPALFLLLGALGLSAWLAWTDFVLLPAFIVFAALALYAWHRRRSEAVGSTTDTGSR